MTRHTVIVPRANGVVLGTLLAIAALGVPTAAQAQQVLLQTDVSTDTLAPLTGPNRRWFGHAYVGYGLAVGGSSLGVKYGIGSSEALLGGRLKRRLTGHLALCADLRYALTRFKLDPDALRPAPFMPLPGATQRLAFHQLQTELSMRLNAGHRGNIVGNYADLFGYGGYALGATYTAELPGPSGGQRTLTDHAPAYLNRWQGGVGLRLGHNTLAVVGRYRLSHTLRGPSLPEPPRFMVGFEVGWF